MKKYIQKVSFLLAVLILINPIINVGAISVKSIVLKDIIDLEEEEDIEDKKEVDDKNTDVDKEKENEAKYKTDREYLDGALKSIEWLKFNLDSDKDENIVLHLKNRLKENGFSKVQVKLKDSNNSIGDKEYINSNGDIRYYYKDPETEGNFQNIQVNCIFELSLGAEKHSYTKNISIGWDKPRVRKMLEEKVFPILSEESMKGENIDLNNIEKDLKLNVRPTKYASVIWESSNREVLNIIDGGMGHENGNIVFLPSKGEPRRAGKDQKIKLIAHIKFNQGTEPNETIYDKVFDITVNGFDVPATKAEMKKQLDENYTSDKLKDSVTGKSIDLDNITSDISLPIPRNTGIKNSFDYKISAYSNNENIKVNGNRVDIMRPLPGEDAYDAELVINMEHRKNKISVEKKFNIKVLPLSQEEIEKEIQLMDMAKENYFQGIKGKNKDVNNIVENLKVFKEIHMENGKLNFVYDRNDEKNIGIVPDTIDGSENQEAWRLFKSSNDRVIKHENLVLIKPEYNTKIKINSSLSSINYKKYAIAYPENKNLQKLYKQPVNTELIVIGNKGIFNPEEVKKEIKLNYAIIYFDKNGDWKFNKEIQNVNITTNEYGELTPYDLLINTDNKYEGSNNWITSINDIKGPEADKDNGINGGGWMYSVNDIKPDKTIGDYLLKDGDKVLFFCTNDYKLDKMPNWNNLDKQPEDIDKFEIKISKDKDSYYVGENLDLKAIVLQNGIKVDKDILWTISDTKKAEILGNKLIFNSIGEVNLRASLKENTDIKSSVNIKILENKKNDLTKIVEDMKKHYANKSEFSFRESIAYNYTSTNLSKDYKEISKKLKIKENETVADISGNIIGIISSGQDPYNYKGINYVALLQKKQNSNGKFIITGKDDYPSVQAFAVIALDMANAKYNDNTINMLLKYQNSNGSFSDSYEFIDTDGMMLSALGNHLDKPRVGEAVSKSVKIIEKNWSGKNQWTLSAIIQGLIGVNEDVNSSKWSKNNKTIVDELLEYYTKEDKFENYSANEQVFMALADIVNKNSMYKKIRVNDRNIASIEIAAIKRKVYKDDFVYLNVVAKNKDGNIVINPDLEFSSEDNLVSMDKDGKIIFKDMGTFNIKVKDKYSNISSNIDINVVEKNIQVEIQGPREDEIVEKNKEYKIKADIENKAIEVTKVKLIVCVYEKNTGRLVNYSIVEKELQPKESVDLSSGIKNSEDGKFYIKTFVWDEEDIKGLGMQE